MKIVVTGGSETMRAGVIPELLQRGHAVRLLSDDPGDFEAFPRAEPFTGSGATIGWDAVLHLGGDAHALIDEAKRSGVRRFVLVSEETVIDASFNWTVVHAAHVYGPGDELISTLITMVRILPAV